MSWWKKALIYAAKKAIQIAGEELAKKTEPKPPRHRKPPTR
jgi:hypothetical protein